ncbi:MAG: VWA domain-containing protein [Epsilonproteobacteria bacterium]|nr:VWA domain-containing protein [Campylobacterota bacterium]
MINFLNIHFAGAERIIWAPLFLIGIFLVVRNLVRIKKIVSILVYPTHEKMLLKNFSRAKLALKTFLFSASLVLIFFALLQPQWGKKDQVIQQEGRDLVIILDISRSMLAKDIKPSRLDFAKHKIRSLLERLTFERVALVLFSGSAFIQCPLTADHAAFLMFLDHVDVETISSGTTSIDKALSKTVEIFENTEGKKHKLALLVTDGEDYSVNLDSSKSHAIKENITLLALGVGTPDGAPIPIIDHAGNQRGHELDEFGKVALTKLNEPLLKDICSSLHGTYLTCSYDDSDLSQLTKKIQSFEKEKFMDKKLSLYEDQYPLFLAAAWVLLVLDWIL